MKTYNNYKEFDADYGFAEKAGFQLTTLQEQDVNTYCEWRRFLNRSEVGAGKTVMSTAVSLILGHDLTLIIVPPILIRPWVRWLRKVSERVGEYAGKKRTELLKQFPNLRWVVMSHAIFRRDFNKIQAAVSGLNLCIIVDEAQALKNVESKLYQKTAQLSFGQDLQLLTATPANSPKDYFSYISLVNPKAYRGWTHFCNLHYGEKDFFGAVKEYVNLDLIAKNLDAKSIVRTKEELHGYNNTPLFPDCTYDLAPEHIELYEKLVEERLLELDDGTKIDATVAQRLYHMSQQIIVNYGHFSGNDKDRSNTYDLIDSTIEQTDCLREGKSKLIIWTYYQLSSKAILAYLRGLGINAVGAFGGQKSQDSVDAFMLDPEVRVGVFQPQSAGAGLNPQEVCWEMLYAETSTVPIYARQSLGRVDRVGQKHKPTIRIGVASGTIQVALLNQLMNNADLVDSVEGSKNKLRNMLLGRC